MPGHNIPQNIVTPLTNGPSETKRNQAANLQQYIQDLLGDTHHTFLQGSYRNHTAVSDLPDVDIVAMRSQTYSGIHSPYRGGKPTIMWSDIFSEIITKLRSQNKYSWQIEEKEKCIKLRGTINADIVPAVKFHHDHLVDPVAIRSWSSERLSHPRTHIANGEAKNTATNGNFKPTVRMFKNWVANHFGTSDVISSFKVEALVHSADNSNFYDDPVLSFLAVGITINERLNPRIITQPIFSVCGSEDIIASWDASKRLQFYNQFNKSLQSAIAAYRATTVADAERYWRIAFNL